MEKMEICNNEKKKIYNNTKKKEVDKKANSREIENTARKKAK